MSKKSLLILTISLIVIGCLGGLIIWLNQKGYIKILGEPTTEQKIYKIDTAQEWQDNTGSEKVDFSSGDLKLRTK